MKIVITAVMIILDLVIMFPNIQSGTDGKDHNQIHTPYVEAGSAVPNALLLLTAL